LLKDDFTVMTLRLLINLSSKDPNLKLLYVICFDQNFSLTARRPPHTPPPLAFRSTPITALIATLCPTN
jgi:hypothetical protein